MSVKSFLSLPFANYVVLKNKKWKYNAINSQKKVFENLINSAKNTQFGEDHDFSKINSYSDFIKKVPIRNYEDLSNYIEKIKSGEKDVLWPNTPIYFCKTSGTTSGTKYIPISKESLSNHIMGARDSILNYISNHNSMRPKLVIGFAAETNDLKKNALKKLKNKNCDWIIANDVSKKEIGFNSDLNEVTIYYKDDKKEKLLKKNKSLISEEIVNRVSNHLN